MVSSTLRDGVRVQANTKQTCYIVVREQTCFIIVSRLCVRALIDLSETQMMDLTLSHVLFYMHSGLCYLIDYLCWYTHDYCA